MKRSWDNEEARSGARLYRVPGEAERLLLFEDLGLHRSVFYEPEHVEVQEQREWVSDWVCMPLGILALAPPPERERRKCLKLPDAEFVEERGEFHRHRPNFPPPLLTSANQTIRAKVGFCYGTVQPL